MVTEAAAENAAVTRYSAVAERAALAHPTARYEEKGLQYRLVETNYMSRGDDYGDEFAIPAVVHEGDYTVAIRVDSAIDYSLGADKYKHSVRTYKKAGEQIRSRNAEIGAVADFLKDPLGLGDWKSIANNALVVVGGLLALIALGVILPSGRD